MLVKKKANSISVLDKGFVKLVDFIGGDMRAIESARVSFGGESRGEDRDKKLLQYLIEHDHWTPFEHSVFQFHVKCPIFVARQWMRHRIASYNEISARYTEVKEEFYIPEKFRVQDAVNRQGSLNSIVSNNADLLKKYENSIRNSYQIYQELIRNGVSREMARMVLPVSQYTQYYWTVNARSLLNFLKLRMEQHAQYEIQQYARVIAGIFEEKMPWTWEAFNKLYAYR